MCHQWPHVPPQVSIGEDMSELLERAYAVVYERVSVVDDQPHRQAACLAVLYASHETPGCLDVCVPMVFGQRHSRGTLLTSGIDKMLLWLDDVRYLTFPPPHPTPRPPGYCGVRSCTRRPARSNVGCRPNRHGGGGAGG